MIIPAVSIIVLCKQIQCVHKATVGQIHTDLWCIRSKGPHSVHKWEKTPHGGFPEQNTALLASRNCSCSVHLFHESYGTSMHDPVHHCLSGPLSCGSPGLSPRRIPLMGYPHKTWPRGGPHRSQIPTCHQWSLGFVSSAWTSAAHRAS